MSLTIISFNSKFNNNYQIIQQQTGKSQISLIFSPFLFLH